MASILCVNLYHPEDLHVGKSVNMQLAYSENVRMSPIPLATRTKHVFYNTNDNNKLIMGVTAIDLEKADGKATITAGGVGATYVNVKIKSNRGNGLNYLVQIYI